MLRAQMATPTRKRASPPQLGRRRTSCVASLRSSYFPCCFIHIVERSSRNTLTRDLVGSSSATCSTSYESELNSVDCTPPGGCRTDILSKYTGPDMLGGGWQESPQPTHTTAATRQGQPKAAPLGCRRQRLCTWRWAAPFPAQAQALLRRRLHQPAGAAGAASRRDACETVASRPRHRRRRRRGIDLTHTSYG